MTNLTICDEQVQRSIREFVSEARICALTPRGDGILGFAAMSTILSCVLSMGEAILGRRASINEAIGAFYNEMPDKTSWMMFPEGVEPNESAAISKLTDFRDALVHQLSMPYDMALFANDASTRVKSRDAWGIVVTNLVDAVESAIPNITAKYGNMNWDPAAKDRALSRGPAASFQPRDRHQESTTSGSAPQRA